MITYLLRLIWALKFQIVWNICTIIFVLYLILFDIPTLKQEIKDNKDFFIEFLYCNDCDYNDWFTFSKKGEWKSIWHWALKIKK